MATERTAQMHENTSHLAADWTDKGLKRTDKGTKGQKPCWSIIKAAAINNTASKNSLFKLTQ